MAHTKGPWRVDKHREPCTDVWRIVGAGGGQNIVFDCSVEDYEGGGIPPEGDDLSLILAAPNLLEMLIEVRGYLYNNSPDRYKEIGISSETSDLLDKVDEVIGRVKGER